MKIRNFMMLAALLAAGLTSCNNDEDGNGTTTTQEGDPTTFNLTIQQPKAYAADPNATAEEVAVKTVDVIIFDGNGVFCDRAHFEESDISVASDNTFTLRDVPTTTGVKEIFVGINIPTELISGYYKGAPKANTVDKVHEITAEKLTENGIAMFSKVGITSELVKGDHQDYSTKNVIKTNVVRLVAKVTVQKDAALELEGDKIEGGKILENLTFATRNVNKLIYAIQQVNQGTTVVVDPNWADKSYRAQDFYRNDQNYYANEYVAVDAHDTNILDLEVKYVTENTSEKHYQWETTYASVRATFIPEEFTDANGDQYDNPNYSTGTPVSFWTLSVSNGFVYYFESRTAARDYAEDHLGTGTYLLSDEYKNGYCYYNMFLNPSNTENNEFGTLRNEHYKTTIKRIYGLGNPNPWDGGDEEIPVVSTTHIEVDVEIVPWAIVSDDYELSKN